MAVFTKFLDSLRSARKVEYLALLILIALALMLWAQDRGGSPGVSTELEQRMERALSSVQGAGDVSVMITESADGAVVGVLIVAEGANDMAVRFALSDAAHTLLGVEASKIEIARMRGD